MRRGAAEWKTGGRASRLGVAPGLLLALTAAASEDGLDAARGLRVREVRFEGLRFTRAASLRAFVDTREGDPLDPDRVRADVERLRNLELFESVAARAHVRQGEADVIFSAPDRWTLLPYVDFLRGGGSLEVIAGVYDANLAGRLWIVGGEYRHFNGRPGAAFFATARRPLGAPVIAGADVLVGETGRTAYEGDGVAVYEYLLDRRRVEAFLDLVARDWLILGGTFEFQRDAFALAESSPRRDLVPPDGDTVTWGGHLRLGLVRFHDDYRLDGADVDFSGSVADEAAGSDFGVRTARVTARGFLRLGERHNLALRVAAGRVRGEAEFQHEFALGALSTSRGFSDDQFRGRRFVVANLEYRANLARAPAPLIRRVVSLFGGRPLQIQGAVFADLGAYDGSPAYAVDHAGDLLASFGGGLRLIVRPLYQAILRVDVARAVSPFSATDVVIGTQQFF